MDIETRIALLEEKAENNKTQEARNASHLESEREVRTSQGIRIGHVERTVEKLDSILRNGGLGLSVRVDRLEQKNSENNLNLSKWLAILALIISLVAAIKDFIL